jgi:hypothetical protein
MMLLTTILILVGLVLAACGPISVQAPGDITVDPGGGGNQPSGGEFNANFLWLLLVILVVVAVVALIVRV